jgi:hypothetical protein
MKRASSQAAHARGPPTFVAWFPSRRAELDALQPVVQTNVRHPGTDAVLFNVIDQHQGCLWTAPSHLQGPQHAAVSILARHVITTGTRTAVRPVSYLTRVSKAVQKETGRAAGSAKLREEKELRQGVCEWIQKKYDHPGKKRVRERLAPGPWSRELVIHRLKHEVERTMIADAGVTVWDLSDVLADLKRGNAILQGAAGAHLVELVALTATPSMADASSATR